MSQGCIDDNNFIKVSWQDIRHEVVKVDPKFAEIIDDLKIDSSYSLYLARYSYGAVIADTNSFFLPALNGKRCRLDDLDVSSEIVRDLGYGKDSLPMGIVLGKQIEYFIDLKSERITLPWSIYSPGSIFAYSTIFGESSKLSYMPNGLLAITSGSRSSFMLPNIGCYTNHKNLQRDFDVKSITPKSLYDHWYIFQELANNKASKCDWRSRILYFSKKWIERLYSDNAWLPLKSYLLELSWKRFAYERNNTYYDIAFSLMQKNRNLKPNPYLADTARHLFTIAMGGAPGYSAAVDDESLPLTFLQEAYTKSYGLKKYIPTIMQPKVYSIDDRVAVYYSLQNPTTHAFSPKSRRVSSTVTDIRELEYIMQIYAEELSLKNAICADTILSYVAKHVEFQYFHNEVDRYNTIQLSKEIPLKDARFNANALQASNLNNLFAADAKFLRGCISIK